MKIVAIIGNTSAPLVYFTNTIHQHHGIDLVIVERKKIIRNPNTDSISNRSAENKKIISFFEKVLRYLLFRIEWKKKIHLKEEVSKKNDDYTMSLFKKDFKELNPEISVIEVADINSKEAEEAIKKVSPNLIIDHGTSLVKSHIIDLADLALNLHWGLSPYYRGVNCTGQAILNWDIHNIGVTIHKLAKKIDGGDVLGQERVQIEKSDNIFRVTCRLTYMGTSIMIKAIDKLVAGEALQFTSQNFSDGFLIRGSYWDNNVQKYIREIDENLIAKMIDKPSRGPAPIVKLK